MNQISAIDFARLQRAGAGRRQIAAVQPLFDRAVLLLGRPVAASWWVPGRIEVLGKHTDYAGGCSLTCATSLGLAVVAAAREDDLVRVVTAFGEVDFLLSDPGVGQQDGWWRYTVSVARRLVEHFAIQHGCDIAIIGNLPPAAGLSSSSAFVVAVHAALAWSNRLSTNPRWLASIHDGMDAVHYLGCHENGSSFRDLPGAAGVGTFGGSQDHVAIVHSQAGHLGSWRYAPVAPLALHRWPADWSFAVAVSGVVAEKATAARGAYNGLSLLARQAAQAINARMGTDHPHLGAILAADPSAVDLLEQDPVLYRRAHQFAIESRRLVPEAGKAIDRGEAKTFATIVRESQQLAETGLVNQVPETIWLAANARRFGAFAASAFGAGFGGSVWAAFPSTTAHGDAQRWIDAYLSAFPSHAGLASIHVVESGPGLCALFDQDDPWCQPAWSKAATAPTTQS